MFDFMIHFVSTLLCFILFYYYMHHLFISKPAIKTVIILYGSLFCLKIIVSVQINPFFNALISMLIYFSLAFLYQGKFINRFLAVLLFYTTSMLSENLSYIVIKSAIPVSLNELWSIKFIPILGIAISRFIHYIMIRMIISLFSGREKGYIYKKEIIYFILLPVSSILIILSLHSWIDQSTSTNIILILGVAGLLISNISVCQIYNKNIEMLKLEKELNLAKEKEKTDRLYYKQFKERESLLRQHRHELKRNYQLLHFALQNQQYDKLNSYIEAMNIDANDTSLQITGIYILDIVLSYLIEDIRKWGIQIKYEIEHVNFSDIDDTDLNVIFGNLLENAITSCTKSKKKDIHIVVRKKQSLRIIKIINSCDYACKENNIFLSLKNSDDHGFGLSNIIRCANKYGGDTNFNYNEKEHIFVSTIIFP